MKTIKELSAQMGISKVSLYKAVKRPEMQAYVSKTSDNVTVVDEDGEALLTSFFSQEKAQTIMDIVADAQEQEDMTIVSVLKDELSQKNGEINSLLKIISNQQAIDGQRLIKDRHSLLLLAGDVPPPIARPRQAGFFSRIFRKKGQ
jgi:DNA-binding transcriptional regulator YhcF (GntR family)